MKSKDNQIRVSVIIPVYNSEQYLPQLLTTLTTQDFNDYEVILIDDCSTDFSVDVIESFRREHPDVIKLLRQQQNGGQGRARDRGLSVAGGKYIMFIDSDDIITHDFIRCAFDIIESYNADIVQFGHILSTSRQIRSEEHFKGANVFNEMLTLREENNILYEGYKPLQLNREFIVNNDSNRQELYQEIGDISCDKIFRRDIIENNDIRFVNRIWEDTIFVYRYLIHCRKAVLINNATYCYWMNPVSTIHTYGAGQLSLMIKTNDQITNIFRSLNFDNDFIERDLLSRTIGLLRCMDGLSKSERQKIFEDYHRSNGEFSEYIYHISRQIKTNYFMFCLNRVRYIGFISSLKLKIKRILNR